MAQSETYVEYARDGRIIKGLEKSVINSRYEEDVYINNHTSVWGSFWKTGNWGYKCCHSFIKNSYCVGESGKFSDPSTSKQPARETVEKEDSGSEKEEKEEKAEESEPEKVVSESSESSSEEEVVEKKSKSKKKDKKKNKKKKLKEKRKEKKKKHKEEDKLQLALRAEEEHNKRVDKLMSMDERKRPYNSMFDVKPPTEEEMEAFMMKRPREDDPMLQFVKK